MGGRRIALSFVLILSLLDATAAAPYGLASRAPVGAFLNGAFPPTRPGSANQSYGYYEAFPNLTFEDPTFLIHEPGTNRLYVGGRQGTIHHFVNNRNTSTKTLFLDLRTKTQGFEDCGLLSMVFHPQWRQAGSPNRGYVYVWYQYTTNRVFPPPNADRPDPYRGTFMRLSRFTVPDGSLTATANSEQVLINQYDRHFWHSGGAMFFGPDGFLYITVGDEGGFDDQFNNAQRIDGGLFSGVLRIDVDRDPSRSHPIRRQPQSPPSSPASYTQNYYIPNDNPWLDSGGSVLEEFWAIGLRSPHRMTRDPVTGMIWLGDVGQGDREEVNLIVRGGNYQWSYLEGTYVFANAHPRPTTIIGTEQPPVWEWDHSTFNTCVIGGYVYRGSEFPELYGKYIFADNTSGRVFALTYNGSNNPPSVAHLFTVGPGTDYTGLSSFGIDANNELYICQMGSSGRIFRMIREGNASAPAPALLSQTGAFSDLTNLAPAAPLIPYDVNAPLWSDDAAKRRWLAVPNDGAPYAANEQIGFAATGEWTFPAGTVFVKHFEIATNETNPSLKRRIETRFLVRDTDGGVYGVTYKWRTNAFEADLLPDSLSEDIAIQTPTGIRTQSWFYPSPQDCLICHNPNANHVLGVKTRQLNRDFAYPSTGVTDNQLRTLNHLGLFTPSINEAGISNYAQMVHVTNAAAPLDTRVRSYFDANCAHCHRPGGVAANWDARFDTPLPQQNIINGPVNNYYGVSNARIIAPGDIARSMLYLRMATNGAIKMPPLARNVPDANAVNTVAEWIMSFTPGALPSPWQHQDIGNVWTPGNATFTTNSALFTVSGSGRDIWDNSDDFHFVFQGVSGDCDVSARVTSVGGTHSWAKAGVMIRETLSPGSRNVFNAMTFESGLDFQWRSDIDGGSEFLSASVNWPQWVRLTRTGNVFRAYYSGDGAAWTLAGTKTISMSSNTFAGLAVTSVTNGPLNTSTFDLVNVRTASNLDSDGDGMPDWWEIANSFNRFSAADANQDADSDRMTNLQEFFAGTDPRNAASVLRITDLLRLTNDIVLRFNVTTGRTYAIERVNLLPPPTWLPITNVTAGTNTSLRITNRNAGTNGQGYFRVRVVP